MTVRPFDPAALLPAGRHAVAVTLAGHELVRAGRVGGRDRARREVTLEDPRGRLTVDEGDVRYVCDTEAEALAAAEALRRYAGAARRAAEETARAARTPAERHAARAAATESLRAALNAEISAINRAQDTRQKGNPP
jgi:hypothetical protein